MAPRKICTEPVLCLYPSHVWPREKSYKRINIATYGPGKNFTCFVKLNPYLVCNIATYDPLKKLFRTCTMSVSQSGISP